jgi:hypothetical protein
MFCVTAPRIVQQKTISRMNRLAFVLQQQVAVDIEMQRGGGRTISLFVVGDIKPIVSEGIINCCATNGSRVFGGFKWNT